jgi:DNA polymerase III subunit gamma/tau
LAYQVLARKWRPQLFSELVGQEHVATTLLNALKSGRMPHALLFTGPRGVGKTSAARILAKSLRCSNAKEFVPCDKCDDCKEIAGGRAIDVIEIDGASNNGVENIRELRETVGYMPSKGKYKIYIIDEVHMLSTSAFNALLKTLEEPPAHVIFIFATTEPQKIPVTILSRVQRFDFRRVPVRKVVERLKVIVDSENVQAEPEALWLIGRESEGSMRDSQSLLDQVITFCGKKITYRQVIEVLGLTDRTLLSQTLKALIERDVQACLDIIERVFHLGYDPKQFAQDLLHQLRNLMIVKVSLAGDASRLQKDAQVEFLDLPDTEIDELKKFAADLSEEDVHLLFDMTLKGVSDVMRAQDPRIVLEMLILRLSQAPRLTSIENLIQNLQSGAVVSARKTQGSHGNPGTKGGASGAPGQGSRGGAGSAPAGRGGSHASAAAGVALADDGALINAADAPSNFDQATARWGGLVENIKREKPLLGAKLEYAAVLGLESGNLTIAFKKEQEFFYQQVAAGDGLKHLMDLVGKHWGRPYKIQVQLANGASGPHAGMSPAEEKNKKVREAEEKVRAQVETNPLVKEAKNVLKAKISSIKEST